MKKRKILLVDVETGEKIDEFVANYVPARGTMGDFVFFNDSFNFHTTLTRWMRSKQ